MDAFDVSGKSLADVLGLALGTIKPSRVSRVPSITTLGV